MPDKESANPDAGDCETKTEGWNKTRNDSHWQKTSVLVRGDQWDCDSHFFNRAENNPALVANQLNGGINMWFALLFGVQLPVTAWSSATCRRSPLPFASRDSSRVLRGSAARCEEGL